MYEQIIDPIGLCAPITAASYSQRLLKRALAEPWPNSGPEHYHRQSAWELFGTGWLDYGFSNFLHRLHSCEVLAEQNTENGFMKPIDYIPMLLKPIAATEHNSFF